MAKWSNVSLVSADECGGIGIFGAALSSSLSRADNEGNLMPGSAADFSSKKFRSKVELFLPVSGDIDVGSSLTTLNRFVRSTFHEIDNSSEKSFLVFFKIRK